MKEAKLDGTILEIFFNVDDDIPVLTNVCVIGKPGEATAGFNPKNALPVAASGPVPVVDSTKTEFMPAENTLQVPPGDSKLKISPRAKNLGEKAGVAYRNAVPSGPEGRIIERDVQTLMETGPLVTPAARTEYLQKAVPVNGSGIGGRITTTDLERAEAIKGPAADPTLVSPYEEVKLSNIRKVIAKAMQYSLATTAQLTLNTSFDASEILAYRSRLKANQALPDLAAITLNDIILYTVARILIIIGL